MEKWFDKTGNFSDVVISSRVRLARNLRNYPFSTRISEEGAESLVKEVKEKLDKEPRFKKYLRENSNWYTELNRDPSSYDKFVKEMKKKYKLRTIDKVDNFVDTVDLVTKIINISNE